jgi:hypothetical protein
MQLNSDTQLRPERLRLRSQSNPRDARRPRMPLRHRPRNPPATVVGRARETARLVEALGDGRCVVIWGAEGIGKSTLGALGMARQASEQGRRGVVVATPPQCDLRRLCRAVAEAVASATGRTDLLDDQACSDELLSVAIDVADEHRLAVLIEDLHHARAALQRELLTSLESYARDSRWIVTSRRDPCLPELAGQTVRLRGLADAAARELVGHWAPQLPPEKIDSIVQLAGGAPLQLRQLCFRRANATTAGCAEGSDDGGISPLAEARRLLSGGRAVEACALAEREARAAEDEGRAMYAADGRLLQCMAELVAGRDAQLRHTAQKLVEAAAGSSSERRAPAARFFAMLADDAVLDPAVLADIAISDGDPTVTRSASALLAGETPSDPLARAVVEATRHRLGGLELGPMGGADRGAATPAWTYDALRHRLWRAGNTIDLSGKPMLRTLLEALLEAGGAMDKASIAAAVWQVRAYHPLRDDKRVHVSIGRLRKLIEDDPRRPELLTTSADGYCFGAVTPGAWLRRATTSA